MIIIIIAPQNWKHICLKEHIPREFQQLFCHTKKLKKKRLCDLLSSPLPRESPWCRAMNGLTETNKRRISFSFVYFITVFWSFARHIRRIVRHVLWRNIAVSLRTTRFVGTLHWIEFMLILSLDCIRSFRRPVNVTRSLSTVNRFDANVALLYCVVFL